MNKEPLVSVIIVNFNGCRYLKGCFDSLLAGSYKNIELILVDNGSTDGSLAFVRQEYPRVTAIDNGGNRGLSVASNRGAQSAHGEFLFFYNNDTIADRRLIEHLAGAMERDATLGIAGATTRTYDGREIINQGVACDIFGYPYAKGEPFYVDAALFVRRRLFEALGGFDERMFLYGEDRDICWRCWLSGRTVKVIPGAVFFHDSACITKEISAYRTSIAKRYWGEFNALRSLLKNYRAYVLAWVLPLYAAIALAECMLFILRGQFSVVKGAYLRAYRDNLRLLGDTLQHRKRIQAARMVPDAALLKRMDKVSGKLRLLLAMGVPQFSSAGKYAVAQ